MQLITISWDGANMVVNFSKKFESLVEPAKIDVLEDTSKAISTIHSLSLLSRVQRKPLPAMSELCGKLLPQRITVESGRAKKQPSE